MMRGMSRKARFGAALAGAAFLATATPVFAADEAAPAQGDTSAKPEKHHSKAKGAAVGGVGGAVVGGKKGAAAGAAGGALVQHHKNKKAAKKAAKSDTSTAQ